MVGQVFAMAAQRSHVPLDAFMKPEPALMEDMTNEDPLLDILNFIDQDNVSSLDFVMQSATSTVTSLTSQLLSSQSSAIGGLTPQQPSQPPLLPVQLPIVSQQQAEQRLTQLLQQQRQQQPPTALHQQPLTRTPQVMQQTQAQTQLQFRQQVLQQQQIVAQRQQAMRSQLPPQTLVSPKMQIPQYITGAAAGTLAAFGAETDRQVLQNMMGWHNQQRTATLSPTTNVSSPGPLSQLPLKISPGKKIIKDSNGIIKLTRDRAVEEQGRRKRMNELYDLLRNLVPIGDKATKEGVLDDTIEYVRSMLDKPKTSTSSSSEDGNMLSRAGPIRESDFYPGQEVMVQELVGGRVVVKVCCKDKPGILPELLSCFSDEGVTVLQAHIAIVDGLLKHALYVKSESNETIELDKLRQALQSVINAGCAMMETTSSKRPRTESIQSASSSSGMSGSDDASQ